MREAETAHGSAGVRQARGVAQDYVDYTSFSRSGFIAQLEFEGFSSQDARVAIDGLDDDWREQAASGAEAAYGGSGGGESGRIGGCGTRFS